MNPRRSVFALVVTAHLILPARGFAQTAKSSPPASNSAANVSVAPASGKEGTTVTITYQSAPPVSSKPLEALIEDRGVHGYVIAHGAGVYVSYDSHRDSKYTVPATATATPGAYTFTIPAGVCGIVIKAAQSTVSKVPAGAIQGSTTAVGQHVTTYPRTSSPTKVLEVSLAGVKGAPATFRLTCDTYTLSVDVSADPALVTPLPGSSPVTATLMVKGPAQVVVGAHISKPAKPLMLLAPLAFEDVLFDTNFGTLAPPSPSKVTTATDGTALVTVSSAQPGTATVRAVAMGIGDGRATVKFGQTIEPEKPTPVTGGPPDGPGETRPVQDCVADTERRHDGIVSSMPGKAPHEIAQALAESDAKSPSVAQCAGKVRSGAGGGDDSTPIMSSPASGNPQLDDTVADANKSANAKPQAPPPSNVRKEVLIGGGAAIGATLIIIESGGGGGGTGGGTTPPTGGGSTPKFDPTTLNGPRSGDVSLLPSLSQVHAACGGSSATYGENVVVNVNAAGTGTLTMNDAPTFPRVYNITVTALNQTVTSQGSFPFFGTPIPGQISMVFTTVNQMTMTETTNYGSCSNTYTGTLSR